MSNNKKTPNPYGKIGGLKHQKKVEEVIQGVIERGLTAIKEKLLDLFEGKKKRFIDVAGMDGEEIIELHQVGKQTKNGQPIKRERIVIDEIEKEIGIKPKFHPYS